MIRGYIRIFKAELGRWIGVDEYHRLYDENGRRRLLVHARLPDWRSLNPYVNDMAAALQGIKGGTYIPAYPFGAAGAPGTSALTMTATGDKIAFIGSIPVAGEVAEGIFRTGTVTTGGTIDLRLETVDDVTTGDPTGTLLDTNSNVAVAIADADDNKTFICTFTATATATLDQTFALVLVNPVSASMQILYWNDEPTNFPFTDRFAAAAWTKQATGPIAGLGYGSSTYYPIPGFWPIGTTSAGGAAITTLTFNSGSNPDELGIMFQFPYPCQVSGYWVWMDSDGAGDMKLYDNAGSELQTSNISSVARGTTGPSAVKRFFTVAQSITKNTNYRLVYKPSTTTSSSLYEIDVPAAAVMDHFSGGQLIHKTARVDAGSFSQTTTKRPLMGVFINQYDDAVPAVYTGGGGMRGGYAN